MSAELTEWQRKKFSSLFDLFDSDGDQRIDEGELEDAMEQLQIETGWPENSRVLSHVTARWKGLLQHLFTVSPYLTEQKWLDIVAKYLRKDRQNRSENPSYRGGLEEFAQLLFLLLDRDRNSEIDLTEYQLFFSALSLDQQRAEECFEKLDTDSDGFLKKTEFEDMTLEFFHGVNPGSHGDWLFGPPPT